MTAAPPWPLGVSSLGLPGASLEKFLALAEAHDCRAVELRIADGEPVHPGLGLAARSGVRIRCADTGVTVPALATYIPVCGEQPVDDVLTQHLRLAADVGAQGIRVFPGGDGAPGSADRGVRRLARAADLATALGVRILVETHDTHPRGSDVARLLAAPALADGPFGAIWDVAHPWVAGEPPAETWRALQPYLSHVQIKDVTERRPGATPALVGEGVLPVDEIADVLTEAGYGGPLVLEWEKPWHASIPELDTALTVAGRWLAGLG